MAHVCSMSSFIACECLASPCSVQAPPLQQEQYSSMTVLVRNNTAAAATAAAPALFDQLDKALKSDEGKELVAKTKGLVVFLIDGQHWTLDLREGAGTVLQGPPIDKPDLTLTISDENFAKMVMGKLSPQQAFLLRKLKLNGSMGLALKLQPILDAAAPRAKL